MKCMSRNAVVALGAGFLMLAFSVAQAAAAFPEAVRASTIDGMKVRNAQGEELGTVRDVVLDLENGKLVYAALDFGGFIGLGDKLFAVPWSALKLHSAGNDQFLVLNISKERLKNAPGFDKSHWPNVADPQWSQVDQFYTTGANQKAAP